MTKYVQFKNHCVKEYGELKGRVFKVAESRKPRGGSGCLYKLEGVNYGITADGFWGFERFNEVEVFRFIDTSANPHFMPLWDKPLIARDREPTPGWADVEPIDGSTRSYFVPKTMLIPWTDEVEETGKFWQIKRGAVAGPTLGGVKLERHAINGYARIFTVYPVGEPEKVLPVHEDDLEPWVESKLPDLPRLAKINTFVDVFSPGAVVTILEGNNNRKLVEVGAENGAQRWVPTSALDLVLPPTATKPTEDRSRRVKLNRDYFGFPKGWEFYIAEDNDVVEKNCPLIVPVEHCNTAYETYNRDGLWVNAWHIDLVENQPDPEAKAKHEKEQTIRRIAMALINAERAATGREKRAEELAASIGPCRMAEAQAAYDMGARA